jgi:O-antigen/teichoic acid export membrane protein
LGLALVVVPLFSMQDYLEGVARSFGWTALAIAPIYLLRQGLIAAAMLAAAASGAPADPWTAVAATLAAVVVSLLVQGAILARRIRRELPPGPVRHRLREWAGASLPMAGTDLATLALAYVDVLLVGLFLPAEDVAVYFAATRLLQFVVFAPYAASAASAQRFADAQARGDRTLLGALVHRTARLTALLTMVAGAGVALAAPELLSLFGPGFATSLPVLAILIAGVLAQGLCGPAEDVLTMLGAERTCALLSAACLVPAVALNLVLIPRYGVGGAAVAMAATGFLRAACLAAAAELRLGVRTHVFGGPGR